MAANPNESSKATRPMGIAGGVLVLSAILMLQLQDLAYLLPRALSSTSTTETYRANRTDAVTNSSLQLQLQLQLPWFKKTIPCGLPLLVPSFHQSASNDNACTIFFPERFFASVGKKYQKQYEASKQVTTEHPVVHMTIQNRSYHVDSAQLPASMTYFHIRKCGGTTMFRSLNRKNIKLPYKVHKYNRDMISDLGIIQDIYRRQQQDQLHVLGDNNNAVVFSFVRDPVIRFLSSVGQIRHMGHQKVRLFTKCNGLMISAQEPAESDSISMQEGQQHDNNVTIARSQALVRCMLDSIRSSSASTAESFTNKTNNNNHDDVEIYSYIDQHMLPQAYELRARAHELDVNIHVMSMTEMIGPTLATLLGDSGRQDRHSRSSRGTDYTHGYHLEPEILTKKMIIDICRIYAVDVLLLQTTRLAPTLCETVADTDYPRR
jgi:Sulfotransferase family